MNKFIYLAIVIVLILIVLFVGLTSDISLSGFGEAVIVVFPFFIGVFVVPVIAYHYFKRHGQILGHLATGVSVLLAGGILGMSGFIADCKLFHSGDSSCGAGLVALLPFIVLIGLLEIAYAATRSILKLGKGLIDLLFSLPPRKDHDKAATK